ncbi:GvpL/GvpF family gas vesicle protein [Methanosarcina spelaei]|uniref:GvpL/GvpF family gas vesicle protein n=1 Tax=Methanosarcina spelaei TaxID=1036679 RepID=UPI000BAC0604|nr:GvpL/GvpF family gas vesicle protein [Methanosarcina spelaei]
MTEIDHARYLYLIANTEEEQSLGDIGLGDRPVYTIVFQDIAAVVHASKSEPVPAKSEEQAEQWILNHNYVIDKATENFNTVLPFSFGCLARGDDEAIKRWLQKNYSLYKRELERLKNSAEYSIQIFYDPGVLEKQVLKTIPELEEIDQKMKAMPKGKAYIFKKKFELGLKQAVSDHLASMGREFDKLIKKNATQTIVEEKIPYVPEKYAGKKVMVAFSCLVAKDNAERLGQSLETINKREGFAVRFTGPWAPFNFVDLGNIENDT